MNHFCIFFFNILFQFETVDFWLILGLAPALSKVGIGPKLGEGGSRLVVARITWYYKSMVAKLLPGVDFPMASFALHTRWYASAFRLPRRLNHSRYIFLLFIFLLFRQLLPHLGSCCHSRTHRSCLYSESFAMLTSLLSSFLYHWPINSWSGWNLSLWIEIEVGIFIDGDKE